MSRSNHTTQKLKAHDTEISDYKEREFTNNKWQKRAKRLQERRWKKSIKLAKGGRDAIN